VKEISAFDSVLNDENGGMVGVCGGCPTQDEEDNPAALARDAGSDVTSHE